MDTRQSEGENLKKLPKKLNFGTCHKIQQATHHLKLVDTICKYEMDTASIVDDAQQTLFCPQTDRRAR